jgi:hypothetical protein
MTYQNCGAVIDEQARRRVADLDRPVHDWDTKREALIKSGVVADRRAIAGDVPRAVR